MSDRLWPVNPDSEPWFRIGRFGVSTTTFFVATVVASWFAWVVAGQYYTITLAYSVSAVTEGELWRIVTWPWADGLSLWTILGAFMMWYFGNMLEAQIGRSRMIWLLVGIWASLTLSYTAVGAIAGGGFLYGISTIQLLVLLLWIAEYPNAPFFFNIPAWVFGLVIVGLQVLTMVAYRTWAQLLALLLGVLLVAVLGRAVGLLSDYPWIPGRSTRPRTAKAPRTRDTPAKNAPRKAGRDRGAERRASDRERLDELLDQINANGIGSLTEAQRKEMLKLRERLRRP